MTVFMMSGPVPAPTPTPAPTPPAEPTPPSGSTLRRETYDAKEKRLGPGQTGDLVRKEGQGPIGDPLVDKVHDNVALAHAFMKEVLGRDSIDGKGGVIKTVVNWDKKFNNAAWDGSRMLFGNGDGVIFSPLGNSLDVVAHEAFHGVVQHTAQMVYRNQPGALNESFGDVFGELVDQWASNKSGFGTVDGAKAADWQVGEDVFTPGTAGDALRSLKDPGKAYAKDRQTSHMDRYDKTPQDNGGVHINSGIPNKAAYEVGVRIGSDKLAKVWYLALTDYLKPTSSFVDAARATLTAAKKLYGEGAESQAVLDAWTGVGVVLGNPAEVADLRTPSDVAGVGGPHTHGSLMPTGMAFGL